MQRQQNSIFRFRNIIGTIAVVAILIILALTIKINPPQTNRAPTATSTMAPNSDTMKLLDSIEQIFVSPAFYPGGSQGLREGLASLCQATIKNTGSGKMPGLILQSITQSIPDLKKAQELAASPQALNNVMLFDSLSTLEPYFPNTKSKCHFSTISVGTVLPYRDAGRDLNEAASLLNRISKSAAVSFKQWLTKSGNSDLEFNWYGSYEMNLATLNVEDNLNYWNAYYVQQIETLQNISRGKKFLIAPFTTKKVRDLDHIEKALLTANSGKLFANLLATITSQGGQSIQIMVSDRVGASTCNANPHTPADAVDWVKQIGFNSKKIFIGVNMELFKRDTASKDCKTSIAASRDSILSSMKYYADHRVGVGSAYDLRYLVQQLGASA
ncbi:hypothetical protein [Arthrobacter livingstonensis]|uniref:hypothetical protein n=1 Tax=Arthrobacter livingstonensis TaxID=670078 RepID=UPI0011B6EEEE|nr:hypothetical protein [Arthrobacter livingstonensis]